MLDASLGAYHAMGYKRPRISDSVSLNDSTFSQQVNVAKKMSSGTEYGDSRRAKAYVARLHSAKYLKCDPLLKELFFPLLTMSHRFGLCSTTGLGEMTAGKIAESGASGDSPDDPVVWSKAAGVYRGIASFTLRSEVMSLADANKLNTVSQDVGTSMISGESKTVYSAYRRFNNGPVYRNNGGSATETTGAGVLTPNSSVPPTVTTAAITDGSANNLRVSEVGSINELETRAVHASNFKPGTVENQNDSNGSTAVGTYANAVNPNWTGQGSVISDQGSYYANLKNTTVRIADGFLEMDITNGKSVSCFIEVVIHAHRKHEASISTQELINSIFNAVQYQQTDRNTTPYYHNSDSQTRPGGWQALWDPTYPLLAVKAQHRKPVESIAKEVHRSNHMLGPGQSKLIKIFLGNLYYDMGNKCANNSFDFQGKQPPETATYGALGFDNPATGVGSLQVTIGHSGVEQLSAPVNPLGGTGSDEFNVKPDTYDAVNDTHTTPGAGFWVGKSFCPSEIAISGCYTEKFYPAYMVDKERRNFSDTIMQPPHIGASLLAALPTALPVQNIIGTVDGRKAVPSNVSSANKNP